MAIHPRLSAGVAILRETPAGPLFLLLRAWRYWDFPKGAVESGETPLQAAIREVQEETGIDDLDFAWGDHYCETPPYNRGKVARYYLARTQRQKIILVANPVTGIREHMEYRWLTHAASLPLLSPRMLQVMDWVMSELKLGLMHGMQDNHQ
jgi:bis(5'-nucleosidyl)-tetraphosphatase